MIRGNGGTGYVRVDWFTPKGLATWGDGRLTVLGTDGYLEIRKNIDIASGKQGGSHLYLVDQKETRYIDCKDVALPFAGKLIDDVLNRTETSMPQKHTFLAMQLALEAEANAHKLAPGAAPAAVPDRRRRRADAALHEAAPVRRVPPRGRGPADRRRPRIARPRR